MKKQATGDRRQATGNWGVAGCVVVALGMALGMVGCPKRGGTGGDGGGLAEGGAVATSVDGKTLVGGACLSCHSEHMLAQQRLTQAQWQKTVTKMVGWGANLEPAEVGPLVAYLSATYGPDAGPYTPATITASQAIAELAPLPDDPIPKGDAERGKPLYVEKCSGCHGQDARGHIGVTLIDRPFLYRATDFAKTIRRGRGKMVPIPLSDVEIGDVLAYLRSLRNAAP